MEILSYMTNEDGTSVLPRYPDELKALFNAMKDGQSIPIIILNNGVALENFVASEYRPRVLISEDYKSVFDMVRGYSKNDIQNPDEPTPTEAVKTMFTPFTFKN